MTDPIGDSKADHAEKCPAGEDLEAQKSPPLPPPPGSVESRAQVSGTSNVMERWRRQDTLRKCSLVSRALGFVFSLLAFIIMASNKHGYGMNFDEYEEYRFVISY